MNQPTSTPSPSLKCRVLAYARVKSKNNSSKRGKNSYELAMWDPQMTEITHPSQIEILIHEVTKVAELEEGLGFKGPVLVSITPCK